MISPTKVGAQRNRQQLRVKTRNMDCLWLRHQLRAKVRSMLGFSMVCLG